MLGLYSFVGKILLMLNMPDMDCFLCGKLWSEKC